MDKIEIEIKKINLEIVDIELMLMKCYDDWTSKEIQKFGNHEQLREKEFQLMEEEIQLREERKSS